MITVLLLSLWCWLGYYMALIHSISLHFLSCIYFFQFPRAMINFFLSPPTHACRALQCIIMHINAVPSHTTTFTYNPHPWWQWKWIMRTIFCDIFQEVGKALSRRSNTPGIHKKCYDSILITLINHHNIKLNCRVCSIHSFTFWCLKHKHRKLGIYASFQMVYGFSLHIKTSLVGWSSKTVR